MELGRVSLLFGKERNDPQSSSFQETFGRMFKTPTVFILGAGASCHYGYPTGEDLVKLVLEKSRLARQYFGFCGNRNYADRPIYVTESTGSLPNQWFSASNECEAIEKAFEQVNPLVIDYFLGWNPRLQPIGKLLIAWVIHECEQDWIRHGRKIKNDWCRFVIHKIVFGCKRSSDLLENRVRFVTFNYDVSLETALYAALSHIELFEPRDIDEFLGNNRVIHVYGKIREVPPVQTAIISWNAQADNPQSMDDGARGEYLMQGLEFLNQIYFASKGLRVIDPSDKTTDRDALEAAVEVIRQAKAVYILGYGCLMSEAVSTNTPKKRSMISGTEPSRDEGGARRHHVLARDKDASAGDFNRAIPETFGGSGGFRCYRKINVIEILLHCGRARAASALMQDHTREELDQVRLVLTPSQKVWAVLVALALLYVPRLGVPHGILVSTRMCGRSGRRAGAIGERLARPLSAPLRVFTPRRAG